LIDHAPASRAQRHHSLQAEVAGPDWNCFDRGTIALFSAAAAPIPITAKYFQTQRRPIRGKISIFQGNFSYSSKKFTIKEKDGVANLPWPRNYFRYQSQPLQCYFGKEGPG
jgi:hypothetical protein